jgi:sulfite exporter TauE/SafE
MCGGFACSVAAKCTGGRSQTIVSQLLYNFGRLTVYAFLGGVAGSVTTVLAGVATPELITIGQGILTLVAGLMMMIIALNLLGFHWLRMENSFGGKSLVQILSTLSVAPSGAKHLAFGVFNGFLPCPLIYAFLAQAMATGSIDKGVLTMIALGLGTFPTMLAMAWLVKYLKFDWRRYGVNLAGSIILVLGVITVARIFVNPNATMIPL